MLIQLVLVCTDSPGIPEVCCRPWRLRNSGFSTRLKTRTRTVAREISGENWEVMKSEKSEKGISGKGMVGEVARTRGVDTRTHSRSRARE